MSTSTRSGRKNSTPELPPTSSTHRIGKSPEVLNKLRHAGINLVIWKRAVPPAIRAWAEASAQTCDVHASVAIDAGRMTPLRALTEGLPAGFERDWLARDLALLTAAFFSVVGTERAVAALDVVSTDACRKYHADFVGARLLCTYAGPGTEWVPESGLDRRAMRKPLRSPERANARIVPDPSRARRASAGDVLVMKGESWPDNAGKGACHRSPPIEGSTERRVLFRVTW